MPSFNVPLHRRAASAVSAVTLRCPPKSRSLLHAFARKKRADYTSNHVRDNRSCSTEHDTKCYCCLVANCRRRRPTLASPPSPRPKFGRGGGRAATPPHATCFARWHRHTYPQRPGLQHRARHCCIQDDLDCSTAARPCCIVAAASHMARATPSATTQAAAQSTTRNATAASSPIADAVVHL